MCLMRVCGSAALGTNDTLASGRANKGHIKSASISTSTAATRQEHPTLGLETSLDPLRQRQYANCCMVSSFFSSISCVLLIVFINKMHVKKIWVNDDGKRAVDNASLFLVVWFFVKFFPGLLYIYNACFTIEKSI